MITPEHGVLMEWIGAMRGCKGFCNNIIHLLAFIRVTFGQSERDKINHVIEGTLGTVFTDYYKQLILLSGKHCIRITVSKQTVTNGTFGVYCKMTSSC